MSSLVKTVPVVREPLHVLGSGSIGLLWASTIRRAIPDYPVTLLLREHHRPNVSSNNHTIEVTLSRPAINDGSSSISSKVTVPVHVLSSLSCSKDAPSDTDNPPCIISNLIVSTKAYQAAKAVASVEHLLDPNGCNIILLCNGALAVREELNHHHHHHHHHNKKRRRLVLATTTHGAYQKVNNSDEQNSSSYHVVHAGVGSTFVEDNVVGSLAELWNDVGLNCQSKSSNDMNIILWQKLAANCVINPLTALYSCPNGQLLENPPSIFEKILQEVSAVAQASSASSSIEDRLSVEALSKFVHQVLVDTQNNQSSMLQDIVHRRQTEVDHLNGYIVQRADSLGLSTASAGANQEMVQRIHELQKEYL